MWLPLNFDITVHMIGAAVVYTTSQKLAVFDVVPQEGWWANNDAITVTDTKPTIELA